MKKRTKISLVLSSAAAILLAGSVMAGGTYALFTSESKTNIAVTSGTVDVEASISELKTYSGVDLTGDATTDTISETAEDGKFTNGGTAKINETTGDLELDKVTPGDKVTFQITVKNNSNVAIKYRTIISCEDDTGLFSGLEFTINENKFDGLNNKSNWTQMASSGTIATLDCEVNLPSDAENEYQDTSCKVSYTVEAVQGNAATSNPDENVIEINNARELGFFRDKINSIYNGTNSFSSDYFEGKTIKLTDDIHLNNVNWEPINYTHGTQGFTFEGNNKTIYDLYVNSDSKEGSNVGKNVGLFGTIDRCTIQNLNVNGAYVYGINHVAVIAGDVKYGGKIDNCTVTNGTVVADPTIKDAGNEYNGDKVGVIVGFMTGQHSGTITNCTVDGNTTVKGYRDMAVIVGHVEYNGINISNNTIKGNVKIVRDRRNDEKGYDSDSTISDNVGIIIGRKGSNLVLTEENNDYSEATIDANAIEYADGCSYNTVDYKYEISNANGLNYLRDKMNGMTQSEKTETYSHKTTTIKITDDIDLNNQEWEPIDFNVPADYGIKLIFDGNNKTISNFTVTGDTDEKDLGLFSVVKYVTFKNVKIDNATVTGAGRVGAIVGKAYCSTFDGCSVTNSTITASTWLKSDGKYDDGDKVGALAGIMTEAGNTITSCSASGNTLQGYRDVGGLVGYLGLNGTTQTVKNNTVSSTTIYNDRSHDPEGYGDNSDEYDVHELIGHREGTITEEGNNTSDGVTITIKN